MKAGARLPVCCLSVPLHPLQPSSNPELVCTAKACTFGLLMSAAAEMSSFLGTKWKLPWSSPSNPNERQDLSTWQSAAALNDDVKREQQIHSLPLLNQNKQLSVFPGSLFLLESTKPSSLAMLGAKPSAKRCFYFTCQDAAG